MCTPCASRVAIDDDAFANASPPRTQCELHAAAPLYYHDPTREPSNNGLVIITLPYMFPKHCINNFEPSVFGPPENIVYEVAMIRSAHGESHLTPPALRGAQSVGPILYLRSCPISA